jgi:hypothetical protein
MLQSSTSSSLFGFYLFTSNTIFNITSTVNNAFIISGNFNSLIFSNNSFANVHSAEAKGVYLFIGYFYLLFIYLIIRPFI